MQQTDNKLNEILDKFANIHNSEKIYKMEMGEERYRANGDTASRKYGQRMLGKTTTILCQ